jgi:nucleoside-diphosphate-sugar epimerase
MKKNRILITGASGYLGKNLCRYFYNKGYEVIAQSRDITNLDLKSISHKQVLIDEIYDLDIDFVVHNLSLTKYFGEWEVFQDINIELSKKIFKNFEHIKQVYISSISVFGYRQDTTLIHEYSDRLNVKDTNIDMYSKSKIEVENFIDQNSLDVSIVRPGLIYGNRAKLNSRQIISKKTTVPLVEINDLCRVVEVILHKDTTIINAVDKEAELRVEYEKDNKNVILLPNFLFEIAKKIFRKPSRIHILNMMNRQNRYDNQEYKRVLNEL